MKLPMDYFMQVTWVTVAVLVLLGGWLIYDIVEDCSGIIRFGNVVPIERGVPRDSVFVEGYVERIPNFKYKRQQSFEARLASQFRIRDPLFLDVSWKFTEVDGSGRERQVRNVTAQRWTVRHGFMIIADEGVYRPAEGAVVRFHQPSTKTVRGRALTKDFFPRSSFADLSYFASSQGYLLGNSDGSFVLDPPEGGDLILTTTNPRKFAGERRWRVLFMMMALGSILVSLVRRFRYPRESERVKREQADVCFTFDSTGAEEMLFLWLLIGSLFASAYYIPHHVKAVGSSGHLAHAYAGLFLSVLFFVAWKAEYFFVARLKDDSFYLVSDGVFGRHEKKLGPVARLKPTINSYRDNRGHRHYRLEANLDGAYLVLTDYARGDGVRRMLEHCIDEWRSFQKVHRQTYG